MFSKDAKICLILILKLAITRTTFKLWIMSHIGFERLAWCQLKFNIPLFAVFLVLKLKVCENFVNFADMLWLSHWFHSTTSQNLQPIFWTKSNNLNSTEVLSEASLLKRLCVGSKLFRKREDVLLSINISVFTFSDLYRFFAESSEKAPWSYYESTWYTNPLL